MHHYLRDFVADFALRDAAPFGAGSSLDVVADDAFYRTDGEDRTLFAT
jgi:hypothetical protein